MKKKRGGCPGGGSGNDGGAPDDNMYLPCGEKHKADGGLCILAANHGGEHICGECGDTF